MARKIAILGGTGPEGSGLANRLARAGEHIVIGSREAPRAQEAARQLCVQIGGAAQIEGVDNAAAAAGIILRPRLEIDTLSAVCEIVAATELVTVLPGIALNPLLSAGRIRAQIISRPAISRSVSWVANPRRIVSGAAAAVVEIISDDLTQAAKAASRLVRG